MYDIPDGYLRDAKGRLVPNEMVSDIDQARDQLVRNIVADAIALREAIGAFKRQTMDDVQAFVELSGEKYNVQMGGLKGNLTLVSYDGKYKVQRAIADHITFDERLQIAKQLIDECIHSWSGGARPEIKALVNDAFNVDKEGKINTGRVLGLRRLDIQDAKWLEAMQAISDSVQVSGTKAYLRIYERVGDTDQYQQIALDVAAL